MYAVDELKAVEDCFELARKMRGYVEEFDDSYIEKWLPNTIVRRLLQIGKGYEIDDEGFWWGALYVWATRIRDTGEIVVAVATKPLGMGCHELKVVDERGNIRIEPGNQLM